MKLTLLCNAGLAVESQGELLLIDLPNQAFAPFYRLPDSVWREILERRPPYDRVIGFYFTHCHPDHWDPERLEAYRSRWPQVPVFTPTSCGEQGSVQMGKFLLQYYQMDHAPIPDPPPHVVTILHAEGKHIYLAADAKLDPEAHRKILAHTALDAAVWNSMYLSRPETRALLQEVSPRNLICHMPQERPDAYGLWKKLERNQERFGEELQTVQVLDHYPSEIML